MTVRILNTLSGNGDLGGGSGIGWPCILCPWGLNTPCDWGCLAGGLETWLGAFPTPSQSGPGVPGLSGGHTTQGHPKAGHPCLELTPERTQLSGLDALILGPWGNDQMGSGMLTYLFRIQQAGGAGDGRAWDKSPKVSDTNQNCLLM